MYFSTVSLTAPIGGVIIGGIVTSAYGGYNTKKAQKIQCIMGCCAVASALPIPLMSQPKDFYLVGFLFWLLLFFGGFILPPVTGIMINSVGEFQKSSANSIANLCYNLLGYLPAPSVYGMIAAATKIPTEDGKGNKSRWAMGVLLYSTILTIGCLVYGINKKIAIDEEQRRNSTVVLKRDEEEQDNMVNQRLIE